MKRRSVRRVRARAVAGHSVAEPGEPLVHLFQGTPAARGFMSPPGVRRLAAFFHHICLSREATSIAPDSVAVSSIFTSTFEPWNVCSSKHLTSFSLRNRLRPPYTCPSEVLGWLVI